MTKKIRKINQCTQAIQKFSFSFSQAQNKQAVLALQQVLLNSLTELATKNSIPEYVRLLRNGAFADDVACLKKYDEALARKIADVQQAAQSRLAYIEARNLMDNNTTNRLACYEEPNFATATTVEAVREQQTQALMDLRSLIDTEQMTAARALLDEAEEVRQQERESYETYVTIIDGRAQIRLQQIETNAQQIINDALEQIQQNLPPYTGLYLDTSLEQYKKAQLAWLNQLAASMPLLESYQHLGDTSHATIEAQNQINEALKAQKLKLHQAITQLRRTNRLTLRELYPDYKRGVEALEAKFIHLHEDSEQYGNAIPAAARLQEALLTAESKFFLSPRSREERLEQFKRDCTVIFNPDTPDMQILATHRDVKQQIANIAGLVLSLITVGLFAPVAYKLGLFARKTDSLQRIDAFEACVSNLR